jgi:ARC6-like, IMS domain
MPTTVGRSPRSPQSDRKRPGDSIKMPSMAAPGRRRIFSRRSLRLDRLMFLLAMGVLSTGLLILLVRGLTRAGGGGASSQLEPLQPQLGTLILGTVEPIREQIATAGPLTVAQAQKVIESWLAIKADANGQNHEVDKLAQILAEPVLASKQAEAERYQEEQTYVEYVHSVTVNSVTPVEGNPDQAEAIAEVKEAAKYFINNQPDESSSYDSTLQVRYIMVRQNDQWLIQEWVTE